MARWNAQRGGLADRPRDHAAPRGNGHPVDEPPAQGSESTGNHSLNPQSQTPGWGNRRRVRSAWLRSNIADVAGNGSAPDTADVNRLPEAYRDRARRIAREAVDLHGRGDHQAALVHAREGMAALEREIGQAWRPPTVEKPDSALLDEIQGVVR